MKNAFICAYWDEVGRVNVTDQQIHFAVKYTTKMKHDDKHSITIDCINIHLLRSGSVCACKLAGFNEVKIQKMGRWAPKSNAWLEYIQLQLSLFATGLEEGMSQIPPFTNMEEATKNEGLHPIMIF